MAEAKIGIQIGADVSNLQSEFKSAENILAKFERALKKATDVDEIKYLSKQVEFAKTKIQQLSNVSAANNLGKIPQNANKASSALTDLSRIAQDAPFGFIAIQNNLSPLIESFGRLSSSSGGTIGALKSLGASLIGPAGIGVGFAVVSSLVTVAIQKYGSLDNAIKDLFGSLSNAEVSQNKLVKSTNDSVASVQGELSVIRALVSVAKDKTISDEARQEAIDKLNKEYDKYLPKLTLENIETDKVTAAVNRLTIALIRKAKIKGFEDLISEEAKEQAKLFTKDVRESASIFAKIADIVNVTGTLSISSGLKNVNKELAQSKERASLFEKELTKLLKIDALEGTLSDTGKTNPSKKVEDALKKRIEALETLKKEIGLGRFQEIELANLKIKINARDAVKNGLKGIEADAISTDIENTLNQTIKRPVELNLIDVNKFKISTDSAKAVLKEFADQSIKELPRIKETFSTNLNLEGVILNFGEQLGQALASGANPIQAAAKSILGLISDLITQMGKALLSYGIVKTGLDKILAGGFAIPGGVAIAAGIAAIAAGTLLKTAIPKFAEGGVVNKATLGIFGEAGPEAVIPLNQLGRIAQQITGGAPTGGLVASGVLRGTDILLSVTRQQRQNGINY